MKLKLKKRKKIRKQKQKREENFSTWTPVSLHVGMMLISMNVPPKSTKMEKRKVSKLDINVAMDMKGEKSFFSLKEFLQIFNEMLHLQLETEVKARSGPCDPIYWEAGV